jgi:hypothetical protein
MLPRLPQAAKALGEYPLRVKPVSLEVSKCFPVGSESGTSNLRVVGTRPWCPSTPKFANEGAAK